MPRTTSRLYVFGSAMVIAVSATVPAWAHGTTERVSVGPRGTQGNEISFSGGLSVDGRFAAFESFATNLVPDDTNDTGDIFVRDRKMGTTRRVSVGSGGVQADGQSLIAAISADGRFVAFDSNATNLVPRDTNGTFDVFVHDRQTGKTERVSLGPGGVQGNEGSGWTSISANGRFVAFTSDASNLVIGDTNDTSDVFVHDHQTGKTKRVSVGQGGVQGNEGSGGPSAISENGRFVAYSSNATNLVTGDTNGQTDVFVHDRQTGKTERVSLGPGGVQGNEGSGWTSISANGRFVAFTSDASNLVIGDTNDTSDVFVHDHQTGKTKRVSVGQGGVQGNEGSGGPSAISENGRFVAYSSNATNLVTGDTNGQTDVFVHDRQTGKTERVSLGPGGVQGNEGSGWTSISANGRFVAFTSDASNLVPGDTNGQTDVFVHDRQTGKTERVSLGQGGVQGNDYSFSNNPVSSWISADGRFVAFESNATNLVAGDTNGQTDVFVRDRKMGTTRRVSVGQDGIQADFDSHDGSISEDGRSVAFWSAATNLVPRDTNRTTDAFVRILAP